MAILAWGVRLVLDRRLAWPWLPFLALPLSLLAGAAFLASRAVPPREIWPFRVGIGGFVGDFLFQRCQPVLGTSLYVWGSGVWPCCSSSPRSGCAGGNPCGSPIASPAGRIGSAAMSGASPWWPAPKAGA